MNLKVRLPRHDSSKKLFADVFEVVRQLVIGLINDAEKEARESIDEANYETLTFIDSLHNVAFTLLAQSSNLTLTFVNEVQRKVEEYEVSVVELVDSMQTLPRISEFSLHDALFGGATIFHHPGSFIDLSLTMLDALVLASIWFMLLMLPRRDFIHLFFGMISFFFSLHFLFRFTNLLIYLSYGWNSNVSLFLTFVLSKTIVLFLSFGSVALHLIALVTHLNRRSPKFLDWKIYAPLAGLSLTLSILSVMEAPSRFWYWMNLAIEMFSLGFSLNLLFFILLLCPCKSAKYSRFEKDVAVKDAKSNLISLLLFYFLITIPLILFDIAVNLGVSSLATFTQEAQCILHLSSVFAFPCENLYFLVDASVVIRPIFALLPAYIILPSFRKNSPWKVWKKARNPAVKTPKEEILKTKKTTKKRPIAVN